LYFGLIITDKGIFVIEYNCRFGDPEAQVVLPRLKGDLVEIMLALTEERLSDVTIQWDNRAAACVVMASGGYPGEYSKNLKIYGIEQAEKCDNVTVYHAGTKRPGMIFIPPAAGCWESAHLATRWIEAVKKAYDAVGRISFENA
jgi:phosphoribosylamine--glycine ligase